LQKDHTVKAHL